jgi:hypothetical protein
MSLTLIDGIKTVALHNGVLRIDCIAIGPSGEERPSGTLLIPANQAGPVLQTIVSATQELEKKVREQQAATKTKAGNA